MDEDRVLRELSADIERTDPRLAARLTGPIAARHRRRPWGLLLLAVGGPLMMGLYLLSPAAFGAVSLLLVLVAPLVVCLWLPPPPGGASFRAS